MPVVVVEQEDRPKPVQVIYLVTVMMFRNDEIERDRTWGWFPTFEQAEDAVWSNDTDMYENAYYNMAVIEEIPWGTIALATKEFWYSVLALRNADGIAYDVQPIAKPPALEHMVSFGMG